jgi:predicted RNase H-like HicB family nuclease
MEFKLSTSTNPYDYEVLIRKRGDHDYASYCPQLNYMIKGTEHEEVRVLMRALIDKYIEKLKSEQAEAPAPENSNEEE